MNEITVKAAVDCIPLVTDFVNDELERLACPLRSRMQIDVALDEILANVSLYAYSPLGGDITVRIEGMSDPRGIMITFIDGGKPFDPLEKEDPDITAPAETRPIGGLGIYLVKKTMDAVSYKRVDGKNILSIKKLF